jgi:hypothetical protein
MGGAGHLREDVPARLSSRLFMSRRGIACHSLALQDDVTVGWMSIVSDLAIDVSATRPGPMSRAVEAELMNLIEDRRHSAATLGSPDSSSRLVLLGAFARIYIVCFIQS